MAYIKYKELTRYFNFREKIPHDKIPEYVFQYVEPKEDILLAFKVRKDIIIFTNHKIVVFDIRGINASDKKIHILPYASISSSAIQFKFSGISLYLVMDSGYQLKLNFIGLSSDDKKDIRIAYTKMTSSNLKAKE